MRTWRYATTATRTATSSQNARRIQQPHQREAAGDVAGASCAGAIVGTGETIDGAAAADFAGAGADVGAGELLEQPHAEPMRFT